jgi:hypothetical protein
MREIWREFFHAWWKRHPRYTWGDARNYTARLRLRRIL